MKNKIIFFLHSADKFLYTSLHHLSAWRGLSDCLHVCVRVRDQWTWSLSPADLVQKDLWPFFYASTPAKKQGQRRYVLGSNLAQITTWDQGWTDKILEVKGHRNLMSILLLWTQHLKNALRTFLQTWHKWPLGLKDELIIDVLGQRSQWPHVHPTLVNAIPQEHLEEVWRSNVTVTWQNMFLATTQTKLWPKWPIGYLQCWRVTAYMY